MNAAPPPGCTGEPTCPVSPTPDCLSTAGAQVPSPDGCGSDPLAPGSHCGEVCVSRVGCRVTIRRKGGRRQERGKLRPYEGRGVTCAGFEKKSELKLLSQTGHWLMGPLGASYIGGAAGGELPLSGRSSRSSATYSGSGRVYALLGTAFRGTARHRKPPPPEAACGAGRAGGAPKGDVSTVNCCAPGAPLRAPWRPLSNASLSGTGPPMVFARGAGPAALLLVLRGLLVPPTGMSSKAPSVTAPFHSGRRAAAVFPPPRDRRFDAGAGSGLRFSSLYATSVSKFQPDVLLGFAPRGGRSGATADRSSEMSNREGWGWGFALAAIPRIGGDGGAVLAKERGSAVGSWRDRASAYPSLREVP